MRTLLIVALSTLLSASTAFAAGTCTLSDDSTYSGQSGGKHVRALTYTCTADSADGSFPSTTVKGLTGWYLYEVQTAPGTVVPTINSDLTLSASLGSGVDDLLGGNGADSVDNSTIMNRIIPANDFHSLNDYALITGDLTMAITNNSINSAVTYIKIIGVK